MRIVSCDFCKQTIVTEFIVIKSYQTGEEIDHWDCCDSCWEKLKKETQK